MKERPIPFSGPMVQALLEGRKTQTRRIVKADYQAMGEREDGSLWPWREDCDNASDYWYPCPYGKPGDALWVRETWRADFSLDHLNAKQIEKAAIGAGHAGPWAPIQYEADGERRDWVEKFSCVDTKPGRYRHARFMPKWASRILLEIIDVRVERLQDISEEDAKAEGVSFGNITDQVTGEIDCDAVEAYEQLWESINGPGSWDVNPWVWVIIFKRIEG